MQVCQKIFKTGGPRCPVVAIMNVLSCPEAQFLSGPLYLTLLRKKCWWFYENVWYAQIPLRVNQINKFMEGIYCQHLKKVFH